MTVLGTRPEIIRLSIVIKKLDTCCKHVFVHTGQNFDFTLNGIFFKDLGLRRPDYFLGVKAPFPGEQVGRIIAKTEKLMLKERPDVLLILGDTNSGLSSIAAKRAGIKVYHMEAGNRCYDDRVPEEINRRIIDHSSDIFMPYTERSKDNLIREGIAREKIFVIGNPIYEVLDSFSAKIERSGVLEKLNLKKENYFLVTMHRAENVDVEARLKSLVKTLSLLAGQYKLPILVSLHPRTKDKMRKYSISLMSNKITFMPPLGLFDFVKLEKNALCVLSDSGTVQEECCIFNVPNVTIRDVTERPETIECGSNIISGVDPCMVARCVKIVLRETAQWLPPKEYIEKNVSAKVLKIILGRHNSSLSRG